MVPAIDDINGCMHLDAADLCASEILLIVDMMDMVVLDHREHATQMSHDPGLATVVDMTASDDMASHRLLRPTLVLRLHDIVTFGLRAVLGIAGRPLIVIVGLQVFPEGDAGASGIGDFTILNDPALGPVRSDHAVLICRGRRPLGRCLLDGKPGKCDITPSFRRRIKAVASHIKFNIFRVGIFPAEIGVDHRLFFFLILLGIPFEDRPFVRFPGLFERLRIQDLLQRQHLIHGNPVQIYLTGMHRIRSKIPVTCHRHCIRIVVPKNTVPHTNNPGVAFMLLPPGERLCSADHCCQRLLRDIADTVVRFPASRRVHIFPVQTRSNIHPVSRFCEKCGLTDRFEGMLLCPVSAPSSCC